MDRERTREYYLQLSEQDICDCEYCRNYVAVVRRAYPGLAEYLCGLGVDIEKPFETMPLQSYDGVMVYACVQYVVIGSPDGFTDTVVDGVSISIADSHPTTDIGEEQFVIELDEIKV